MMQLLSVSLGGALGALARYFVATSVNQWGGSSFPWGTLLVNVAGSFLIGALYVLIVERAALPQELKMIVMTGFLGAFTTFSTFSLEAFGLYEQGQLLVALGYVAGSLILCLVAVTLGVTLARI
jgi:CrcB protein